MEQENQKGNPNEDLRPIPVPREEVKGKEDVKGVEGSGRVENSNMPNTNESGSSDKSGRVRCRYDSRLFCKHELNQQSNEEKWGCELCFKIQTRTIALTNQIEISILLKKISQQEQMAQNIMAKKLKLI